MKRLLCVSLLVAFGVLPVPSATLAWWPDERNQDRKEKERGDKEANDNKGQKQADRGNDRKRAGGRDDKQKGGGPNARGGGPGRGAPLGACPRIAIVARARLVESDFSII